MAEYTRENNPAYFFDGKGSSEWIDPFKGIRDVPYLDLDWQSAAKIRLAHGIMAAAAFVILFPLGAVSMALFPWWLGVDRSCVLPSNRMGYVLGGCNHGIMDGGNHKMGIYNLFNNYHIIIGLIILAFIILQPVSGALGHRGWQKYGYRSGVGSLHVWIGRLTIIAGMINGGLGLYITGNTNGQRKTAYASLAGMAFMVWFVCALVGMFRHYRRDVLVRPRAAQLNMIERITWRFRR